MKKRIISVFLAVWMLFATLPSVALAAEAAGQKDYYSLDVIHTDYTGKSNTKSVDFMVLTTSSGTARVYIKAEDFSKVVGGDYSYEYNQTYTECAYVSPSTKHVVRYMLNSSNVSVIYVGESISYKSPFDTLYEDGVTWLPFEFSIQLFHLQAIPTKDTIQIISYRYNPISVANMAHQQVREMGFNWMDEVGESLGGYMANMVCATTASCINKLLSFEPSAWGAILASAWGNTAFIDAEFAETIAQSFISPSQQEIKVADFQSLNSLTRVPETCEMIMELNKPAEAISHTTAEDFVKSVVNRFPSLGKSEAIINIQKALKEDKNGFTKVANKFLAEIKKGGGESADFNTNGIKNFLKFIEFAEIYLVFINKNERAVSALSLYADRSRYRDDDSYDEIDAFERYSSSNNDFTKALNEFAINSTSDIIDDAAQAAMGIYGIFLSAAGITWNLMSGIGPLGTVMSVADSRVVSEYAIRYQDDALGVYYNCRSKCIVAGGANEESLDNMLNAMYAYLKFSYIARNAASAVFQGKADVSIGDHKINPQEAAEKLSKSNEVLAEYLVYMERDVFTPSDAITFAWDDAPYSSVIVANGTSVEKPTQQTEPIFEFPDFPGFEDDSYISEEEAIELVKEVMNKYSGGIISNKLLGEYLDKVYTYKVIDGYVDGDIQAYVVLGYTNNKPDAMFFVSVIGTEVWLGTPKSDGGYYVYTDLDLLHAGLGDLIGAIGRLSGQILDEAIKDTVTTVETTEVPAE